MGWYDDPVRQVRAAQRILGACASMAEARADQRVSLRFDVYTHEANAYSEPGYCAHTVCLGDWNKVDQYVDGTRQVVSCLPIRACKALCGVGVECEWSDEWASCSDCGRLVRTNSDSMSWVPSYLYGDGEIVCRHCATPDYILALLAGQAEDRAPVWVDLSACGLVEWATYSHERTAILEAQVVWVVSYDGVLWVSSLPDESKEHLLSVMAQVGACSEATMWVRDHASIDACEVVQDRTHPKGNEWAAWLHHALESRAQGGVWFDALESRVQDDLLSGEP